MFMIPNDLAELAQHIEDSEKRGEHVRGQIARWASEDHDTTQARDLLDLIERALQELYQARAALRKTRWVVRDATSHGPSRGSASFMVMARCPTLHREVPTGIITDFATFNRLAARHFPFRCSVCGEMHPWSIDAARLAGAEEQAAWVGSVRRVQMDELQELS